MYAIFGVMKLLLALGLSQEVELTSKNKEDIQLKEQERTIEAQPMLSDGDSGEDIDPTPKPEKKGMFPSVDRNLWSFIVKYSILLSIDVFATGAASL